MASSDDALLACGFNAAAGTEAKRVFASSDGATTWRKRAQVGFRRDERRSGLSSIAYIYGLSFSPSGAGILFSDSPFLTGDRGRDWTAVEMPDGRSASSGQMFTTSDGVLLDDRHLIATSDGGRTWTLVHRWPRH